MFLPISVNSSNGSSMTVIILLVIFLAIFTWYAWYMRKLQSRAINISFDLGYDYGARECLIWTHDKLDLQSKHIQDTVRKSTARYYAGILNAAYQLDPDSVGSLFLTNIPVNAEMVAHPTIGLGESYNHVTISPIGIVNGLLPASNLRYKVSLHVDPKDGRLLGFKVYDTDTGTFVTDASDEAPIKLNFDSRS